MKLRPLADLGAWWAPAVIAVGGLAVAVAGWVRVGGWAVAASLVLSAVLRVVGRRHPSGLEVRSVTADVLALLVLACLLAYAVAIVDLSPPL
ncbi:MAG TPA: DUF3017 domain-containing protein [Candidatus Lustribacter sp.]|nr:DUF3017 domain-containing protein [Candidatus Lustribacter sp.]